MCHKDVLNDDHFEFLDSCMYVPSMYDGLCSKFMDWFVTDFGPKKYNRNFVHDLVIPLTI